MNPELLCHRHGKEVIHDASGGYWERGYLSELITLDTAEVFTESAADLLPADALIESVTARVTADITTATEWAVGDGDGYPERFSSPNSTLVEGTRSVGLDHHLSPGFSPQTGPVQSVAGRVRITLDVIPDAGSVRVVVFYQRFSAPTS